MGQEWPEPINRPGRVSRPNMHRRSGRRSEGCAGEFVAVAVAAVGLVLALRNGGR